nr:uroporphyrinogen decarboxylase family protein [uncultured Holophaga sp.]
MPMTSTQRIQAALMHTEGDRVPFILSLVLHGAKAVGLDLPSYFRDPKACAEGQIKLRERYGTDALAGIPYAAVEYEGWGGESLFSDEGSPNAGAPLFGPKELTRGVEPPRVRDSPRLQQILTGIRHLRSRVADEVPIIGQILSPFALPIFQIGFSAYLDLLYEDRPTFWSLMTANTAFALEWAEAQADAGASALVYGDPLASGSLIPLPLYQETGARVAADILPALKRPVLFHLGSASVGSALDTILTLSPAGVSVGFGDELAEMKTRCKGQLALAGNLNGIAMIHWSAAQATEEVRKALALGGPGGGFVLTDQLGELPISVPEEIIGTIAEAARTLGRYPLQLEH